MKFQPIGPRILIKQDTAEKKTEGGLFIPQTSERAPLTGIVLAVGPGYISETGEILRPCWVKSGQRILFANFTAERIEIDNEEFLVLHENNVLGVITDYAE